MNNALLIVNPASQGGAVQRVWPDVERRLRAHIAFQCVQTEAPRHAVELAARAGAEGYTSVVAVGGDGTIHEVVNGLMQAPAASRPVLGIIPLGTGGDLRRTLGLPTNVVAAAKIVAAGHARAVDVGWVTYTNHQGVEERSAFINVASFGVSGEVVRLVNASKKRLGRLTFAAATAKAALRYQNKRVLLRVDDEPAVAATINTVAICNGKYFGGAMRIAPDADVADGRFDLVVMGDLSLAQVLLQGPRVYAGTHLSLANVTHRRAQRVVAEATESDDRVLLDIDGENLGRLPATFACEANALRVMVPALGEA